MAMQALREVARALVAGDKGLLAMDEASPLHKRFAAVGIPQTEEARRAYRELLATTPRLSETSAARSCSTRRCARRRRRARRRQGPRRRWNRPRRQGRRRREGPRRSSREGGDRGARRPGERLRAMSNWAPVSPSGARCSRSASASPAAPASRPRPCLGALRRLVPGSGSGPGGRAGSADGRRSHARSLPREPRKSCTAYSRARRPRGDAGGDDPQSEHDRAGIGLRPTGDGRGGRRRHGGDLLRAVPAAVPGIAFLSGGQSSDSPRPGSTR